MTVRLDVFYFGPATQSERDKSSLGNIRFVRGAETPLSQMPARVLNQLVADSEGELLAFVGDSTADRAADFESAVGLLEQQPLVDLQLRPPRGCGWLGSVWEKLPPWLASLVIRPDQEGVVFIRRTAFAEHGPFADVSAPLWDWLIRAVRSGSGLIVGVEAAAEQSPASEPTGFPELVPVAPERKWNWLRDHLRCLEEMAPRAASAEDAVAVQAGLLQLHDFLDESHQISQSVQGAGRHRAGDYWHAIMHRREPDYSNAKYWFRRVGKHPIFDELGRRANDILEGAGLSEFGDWQKRLELSAGWNPFAFVDLCQVCEQSDDASLSEAARAIQLTEMMLLLEQTYRDGFEDLLA
jgi:hypothetical protein